MTPTVDASIFKAYDVRGLYCDQIDEDVAYRLGRGFARVLADMYSTNPADLRLAVGRDMRLQAESLSKRSRRACATRERTCSTSGWSAARCSTGPWGRGSWTAG